MSDYNGRIAAVIRACADGTPGSTEARLKVREILRAERREGWEEGYSDGLEDQYQGSRAERAAAAEVSFGTLDEHGHLTPDAGGHDMWTIAAWLPQGRAAEVAEFLAGHGIEVYRMWQAKPGTEEAGR